MFGHLNNFKGGNGKESYIEVGGLCTMGFLTIHGTSYKLSGQHEILKCIIFKIKKGKGKERKNK